MNGVYSSVYTQRKSSKGSTYYSDFIETLAKGDIKSAREQIHESEIILQIIEEWRKNPINKWVSEKESDERLAQMFLDRMGHLPY